MAETLARTVLYGLIAGASPLAFTATAVILRSRRGRLNGALFALAFLLGTLLVVGVATALGAAAAPGTGGSRTFAAALELALGGLLLVAASRVRRAAAPRESGLGRRTKGLLDRLASVTPAAACWAGALLGIGGPKRLTVSVVAAATISAADLTTAQQLDAAVVYVAVGSLLVWVPVALFLVAGNRAAVWLDHAQTWLMANQRLVASVALLVLGALLAVDGLAQLL